MKKIPTLFERIESNKLVIPQVQKDCEWVVNGFGIATIKYDGTCCMVKDGKLYARYQAKTAPTPEYAAAIGFIPNNDDGEDGHRHGWRLVDSSPNDQYHREAWENSIDSLRDWTYELVGPKVQSNPYNLTRHVLVRHGVPELPEPPRTFEGLRDWLEHETTEGIVWWKDINDLNCEKCKIKKRDFNLPWPVKVKK